MLPEYKIAKLIRRFYQKTGIMLTVGTVESATGGGIADRITDVPGSFDYFQGSVVSYSNEIKSKIVGVNKQTLATNGAVSRETAIEMAESGRKLLNVDVCVSDTGIAGPSGGTKEKPVGLFYTGIASSDGDAKASKFIFSGNRHQNKQSAAIASLEIVEEYLKHKLDNLDLIVLEDKKVVACFLRYKGKILLVKRSDKVGAYRGRWSGIAGYVEGNIQAQALKEIREETGLKSSQLGLVKKGKSVKIIDEHLKTRWIIYPFLFDVVSHQVIKLDWENVAKKWVVPDRISNFNTVPGLQLTIAYIM
jgi:nicotinamide-nucleotide amidase